MASRCISPAAPVRSRRPAHREGDRSEERLAELSDPAFKERPNILAFGVGDAEPKIIQPLHSMVSSAPARSHITVLDFSQFSQLLGGC